MFQPQTGLALKAEIGREEAAGWAVRQIAALAPLGVFVVFEAGEGSLAAVEGQP